MKTNIGETGYEAVVALVAANRYMLDSTLSLSLSVCRFIESKSVEISHEWLVVP